MDIEGWLGGLGLERYAQAFRANAIDARSLPHLTGDDLKELGVTAIGHRRLLLQAIADLERRSRRGVKAAYRAWRPLWTRLPNPRRSDGS